MKTVENQEKIEKKKREKKGWGWLTSGKRANKRWIDGSTCVQPNINPLRRAFVRLQQLSCERSWRDSDPFFNVFVVVGVVTFHTKMFFKNSCCCDWNIIYTCKSVKFIVILSIDRSNFWLKSSLILTKIFFPKLFFSCYIFPVTGQHFSLSTAATSERLFHRRRAQRRVKLKKLIATEGRDL